MICGELGLGLCYVEAGRFEWWLCRTVELGGLTSLHMIVRMIGLLHGLLLEDIAM